LLTGQQTRISGTFLSNTFPMVAALVTIKEIEAKKDIGYMWKQGNILVSGFNKLICDYGFNVKIIGLPSRKTNL